MNQSINTDSKNSKEPQHKCCLDSHNISKEMKDYVRSVSCRRVHLLLPFMVTTAPLLPKHACCDLCRVSCECLCPCQTECHCDTKCSGVTSVLEHMITYNAVSEDNTSSESSSSDTDSLSSSDSDIGYISRKPRVIVDSSDDSSC